MSDGTDSVASPERFTILCVCAGNIHRSALAEALLQTWVQWYLPSAVATRVDVRSAGLIAEAGVPMGAMARRMAAALGADDRIRTATTLTDDLIGRADLILTATRRQADEVVRRVPSALRTVFTMRQAGRAADEARIDLGGRTIDADDLRAIVGRLAGHRRGGTEEDDVIDPQGRGGDAYFLMARQEVPALAALAQALLGMSAADRAAYVRVAADSDTLLSERPVHRGGE